MTMPTHRPLWHFLELPLVPYEEAQALQVDCVAARRDARLLALLFLPFGLVMRLLGKDPMHRKWDDRVPTYRVKSHHDAKDSVERPF